MDSGVNDYPGEPSLNPVQSYNLGWTHHDAYSSNIPTSDTSSRPPGSCHERS